MHRGRLPSQGARVAARPQPPPQDPDCRTPVEPPSQPCRRGAPPPALTPPPTLPATLSLSSLGHVHVLTDIMSLSPPGLHHHHQVFTTATRSSPTLPGPHHTIRSPSPNKSPGHHTCNRIYFPQAQVIRFQLSPGVRIRHHIGAHPTP